MSAKTGRADARTARVVLIVIAMVAACALTACGDGSSDPKEPKDKGNSRADVKSGGPSKQAILPEGELPKNWRYATEEDFLGIPQVCGVILEPPKLTSAITQRFTKSALGPFVIQFSFVSSDEAATKKRIDEFVSASDTCSTHKPTKDSEVKVSKIDDIEPVGDAFGAVHAVNAADESDARDFVVFRTGSHVTVLLSYSPSAMAPHADLASMAKGIAARVAAADLA